MVQKQLAFMLGRQQIFIDLEDIECSEREDLTEIMQNVHLNNNFLGLAREVQREPIMAGLQNDDLMSKFIFIIVGYHGPKAA